MRTNAVVKKVGMDALVAALGYVDAERFIVMINSEPFDYTEWRKHNLIRAWMSGSWARKLLNIAKL